MSPDHDLKRMAWRAHHRGTREADMLVGGFFDAHCEKWSEEERETFVRLLDEQDVDIMAWALGRGEPPSWLSAPMLEALRRLDYVRVAR